MTEDTVKALVIKENICKCQLCRNADSSCQVCKVKEGETRNPKKNITELEDNTEHLNSELKVNYERIIDLDDRLTREKKLRKCWIRIWKNSDKNLTSCLNWKTQNVSQHIHHTCDSCSSSDESDRDPTITERERRKVVRNTRKVKQGKGKLAKVKAHESEEVAVKERQRINRPNPQPENGG